MNKESITLSYKQIGAIALILFNILLVGPGGWTLKHLWNETQEFRTTTETDIEELKNTVNQLSVDLHGNYVTRKSFASYREQMGENIRHIDSKIRP